MRHKNIHRRTREAFYSFLIIPSWQWVLNFSSYIDFSGDRMSVCSLEAFFLIPWHLIDWCFMPLEIFHKAVVYKVSLSLPPFIVFENGINFHPKKRKCLLLRSTQTFREMMIEGECLQIMERKWYKSLSMCRSYYNIVSQLIRNRYIAVGISLCNIDVLIKRLSLQINYFHIYTE